ncbi:MAG: aminopeptidase P family protein [Lachnospiraceae bacterium]|nr:aminopeptidase P family protein [Lachnospiraceae bacterium]
MDAAIIRERLRELREAMQKEGIDFYLIPSSDYHNSEYAAPFFQTRAYFSGFTGSNGTLLVSKEEAGLWTDGRYFVQAAAQLKDTGITMYKMMVAGEPTILEYLKERMPEGSVLGFDGMTLAAETGVEYAKELQEKKIKFRYDKDLAAEIWKDRPPLPCTEAFVLPEEISGASYLIKSTEVRAKMKEYGTEVLFLAKLDDICWLTNLRAADVACNPVMLSYLLLTMEHAYLFVQPKAVTEEVRAYCRENGITVMDYAKTLAHMSGYAPTGDMLFDRSNVSYTVFTVLRQITLNRGHKLINRPNPTLLLKACKNETELRHTRETYLADSAVLTEFLYWAKHHAGREHLSETDIAEKIDGMRAQMDGFLDLSFDTIAGYGANGAIVHYKPEKETAAKAEEKGFLLVDSGGNFKTGTTDVTRTIALGELTEEMKKHFTLVCAAMLRLANAVFPYGCTGRNLDTYARAPLWAEGLDYQHGTGHGIGFVLNVHEGPQNIRWKYGQAQPEVALEAGMLVSDEPGIYIEGSHGIRTENILEVREWKETEQGRFLCFHPLTYAPIDPDAIDLAYLTAEDREALNRYHEQVYECIAPRLADEKIREWLKEVTRPL